MPPKPFNPPRPQSSSNTDSKPRGRPKGPSTNPSHKRKSTSATPRAAPKAVSRAKGSAFIKPRVSNASVSTALSIDSSDGEGEGEGEDEGGEHEEDEELDFGLDSGLDGDETGAGEEEDTEMMETTMPEASTVSLDEDQEIEGDDNDDDDDHDDDPFSSQPPRKKRSRTSKTNANADSSHVRALDEPAEARASIPTDLINVLLHSFFKQPGSRITKDANAAVGRYIETFVREGVARAEWARENGWEGDGEGGVNAGGNGGYLEVEDLERAAPQLILDF
ncbi:hypothetical protein MBM_07008 [Drepanopeziza brunnea f. sp. 'multigermtubi' MB_m1]|uniref:CENP-S complex centromere protein X n=1 Tax=Marssonina brunnea f. sp. multigermtubi (strain MB_m1) TaxID=1072389 RepID=K1WR03_MARBU|nr:uncharacterized protein MBM_07008 [Drepanopeziza brunnea f. sp. 'multigermtubi' MB_m1]EKD14797.1 hypothetical protein MBM_07008 [Drepanopeziza brunnea f. sp. 'multigermtubi' MB_m1]